MLDRAALHKRDARLSIMGVQPWYARTRLEGAAHSSALANILASDIEVRDERHLDIDFHIDVPIDESQAVHDEPSPVLHTQRQALSQDNQEESPPPSQSPSPSAIGILNSLNSEPGSKVPQELALHAYASGRLLIITESDHGLGRDVEKKFVENMVIAISGSNVLLHELGEFVWPVFRWPHANDQVSHQDLMKLIQRFVDDQGVFDMGIYFGDGLAEESFDQLRVSPGSSFVQIRKNTPSQCVRSPAAKLRLWESLLPQRARLKEAIC